MAELITLALILTATAGGTLASYFYDEDAPLAARLCAGACTGLALLGLSGFVFASLLGLTPLAIALAVAVSAVPLLLLKSREVRAAVRADLVEAGRSIRRAVLQPSTTATGYFLFYLLVALLLWSVFERAMFELPEGIYTGVQNNYGDLPFHLSVITSFARGQNFPPQDPTFAGVRFTYPFLSDFVAAIFVRAGTSLRAAMLIENLTLALSFVGLLHRWALLMMKDRLAALVAPVLVLFSGGLGWIKFLRQLRQSRIGLFNYLVQLPQEYTISGATWRWGNALTTLLVPQRSMLFGLPLAVVAFTLFRQSTDERLPGEGVEDSRAKGREKKRKKGAANLKEQSRKEQLRAAPMPRLSVFDSYPLIGSDSSRRMIGAGIITGLLPLVHAHTLMVVMLVAGLMAALREEWRAWVTAVVALVLAAGGLALLTSSAATGGASPFMVKGYIACIVVGLGVWGFARVMAGPSGREWLIFFAVAALIAGPQLLWVARGSSIETTSFIGLHFGWDHGNESVWLFWLKNTGLFIPLLLGAMVWLGNREAKSRSLLFYYLPFTFCFFIPNLFLLAPWVWDNIKVLFYWYLASAPLVAWLLVRLWRGRAWLKAVSLALLLSLILAGMLDVWGVIGSEHARFQEFERSGLTFAQMLEQKTAPRSLILHAPTFNHPVFLTGRQSLMGYPGHIWTHGLRYQERQQMIERIYAGAPDAASLVTNSGVEYIVLGPLERQQLRTVNELFLSRYPLVFETEGYRLYRAR